MIRGEAKMHAVKMLMLEERRSGTMNFLVR